MKTDKGRPTPSDNLIFKVDGDSQHGSYKDHDGENRPLSPPNEANKGKLKPGSDQISVSAVDSEAASDLDPLGTQFSLVSLLAESDSDDNADKIESHDAVFPPANITKRSTLESAGG